MRTSTAATTGLALLTLGAALLTLNNFQRAGQGPATAETQKIPRYTLRDAHWTRLDVKGQAEYVVTARTIEYFDDKSSRLVQPHVTAFGGETSPWELTAPAGSTRANSRDLLLSGNVLMHGRWRDGREMRVTTPHLWLDSSRRIVHTDTDIALEAPGRSLRARGLVADADGETVKLLGKVHGVYTPAGPSS